MQRHLLLPLLLATAIAGNGQALHRAPSTEGYELVYSEDFDGVLDSRVWNIEVNGNGGGNNELQYYVANNVTVADGALRLTARREDYGGRAFTSGRVNTMGKVAFKHGIVQAGIKLPRTANGLWPAFWLMGNDMSSGTGWPYCGEIDVLEAGGARGIASGTQERFFISALHWGPYTNGEHPMYGIDNTAPYSLQDGEYHLYTLVWDESRIAMYLDDQAEPYYQMNIDDASQQNSPGNYFHKRFFLLFNVAVGGSIPGIYDAAGITALSSGEQSMCVDYVRIWQKPDQLNYVTPDGSRGSDEPVIPDDNTTELGQYGSLSLDDNGASTFDFEHSSDYVIIGASQGVIAQMGDRIRADYSVDDVNNFLWIWDATYAPAATSGVNSFGLEEGWNSYVVQSVGWSGLGYASLNVGKDLSMLDEDGYILHFAMRGTDPLMHTGHAVSVGAANFTIGAQPFVDNGKTLPVLGDFKRDGRWCSFDIPVSVLKNLGGTLFDEPEAVLGNAFAVLSGAMSGSQLQFDNVFFYKNPNVNTELPTEDNTTQLGRYGSRALDDEGHTTFDFDDAYDYVVIGASQGVIDQMGDRICADYSVDDVHNFLYIWDGTYSAAESEGVNSFGLDEPYPSFVVGSIGWSGLGYASQGVGKDLSMLDDNYYLHIAFRGTDLLRHVSHTVWVGASQFVIGNTSSGPVMLGDYKRDGQWYAFDIPYSEIKALSGDPFAGNAEAYLGNVLAMLSGGNQGAELQFDNAFFYRRHSDDGKHDDYDPELGRYGSRSLDDEGRPTFDLDAHKDYVLISLGENEAQRIKDVTLADYRPDDVNNFLWVWSGTYSAAPQQGVNSFGEQEGYNAFTVGTIGWSGLGFASQNVGKDLTMLDDSYRLHVAFKGTDSVPHASHAIGIGNAHFTVGKTPFVDGGNSFGILGDFKRDGQWYSLDIPYSELTARANPLFGTPEALLDNVFSVLSGAVTGTELNFDAVFFYRDKGDDGLAGDVNGDGRVDIEDVNLVVNAILAGEKPAVADVTGDGNVDIDDVNRVINIILDL